MAKFNKLVKATAAFAMLATLAPAGASAAMPSDMVAKAEVAAAHAPDRVLVKFKDGVDTKAFTAKSGARELKTLGNSEWKLMTVPAGMNAETFVLKTRHDTSIEAVELDYVMTMDLTPNDPSYGNQYHLPRIQADRAWDITTGSTSNVIAIIDTGVDLDHPDLASKIVAGYDFVNGDSVADDDHGHGTHCAGIATAITNNSNQVAGVDWNAKIMPIKVLNRRGSGYTSDIIEGVYWAADNGADVISMSLGGGSYNSSFQSAIDYAWKQGVIIVAAAGNSGDTALHYPAAYNNVVSVASTDANDNKSSFSTYGTWVDVAAPGSSILSTAKGGGTTTMSGTSMATPAVAGLMTLAWSKKSTASNSTVVSRIFNTADAIPGTGSHWIHGRVNAYNAVNGF